MIINDNFYWYLRLLLEFICDFLETFALSKHVV